MGLSGWVLDPPALLRETSPAGKEPRVLVVHGRQDPLIPFDAVKQAMAQLKAGDAFRISSGGGGYGAAFERPAEDVQEDVRQGYVSVKAAAEKYGVVIDPQTFAIDQAATEKLRAS